MDFRDREKYWKACNSERDKVLSDLGIERPQCGFDVGLGWIPIVREALEKMVAAGWDKDLGQVKQKFCELRIYADQLSDETRDDLRKIVAEACAKADSACEACGLERERKGLGWGMALCKKCEARR